MFKLGRILPLVEMLTVTLKLNKTKKEAYWPKK